MIANDPVVFYVKEGSRYRPVRQYEHRLLEALPFGTHLITVSKDSQSTKHNVDPALAPAVAVGMFLANFLTSKIYQASELKVHNRAITEEQRAAFRAFLDTLGDDRCMLTYGSAAEIADNITQILTEEIDKMLSTPALKKAYEHFIFLAKLQHQSEESK